MKDSRYVLTWLLGLVLVFPTLSTNAGDSVPVLIWDGGDYDGSLPKFENPLQTVSQDEFEEFVEKKVGGSQNPILVFVSDNLCTENFSKHDQDFTDLNNDKSLVYLSKVDSPLSVFKSLPFYNQSHLDDDLETIIDGQVVTTTVKDLDAVYETFRDIKKSSPNLIAALTGKSCSFTASTRVRRAAEESQTTTKESEQSVEYVKTERILMYYAIEPSLNITHSEVSTSDLVEVKQEGEGTHTSPLALNFVFSIKNGTSPKNASIILELNMNSTSYYMGQAYYKENEELVRLTTQSYFVFPYNVSYHCSGDVRFYRKKMQSESVIRPGIDFLLSNFQIQIDPKNTSFNYAFDCVGFTSAPIWSGLFVTLILGLIMIWGLTMIMDIRTMDRFDDPKGKTITVTASE